MGRRAAVEEAKTHDVSVRLTLREYTEVVATAKTRGIPAGRLARLLITYALADLARSNQDLQRAIKTSRHT